MRFVLLALLAALPARADEGGLAIRTPAAELPWGEAVRAALGAIEGAHFIRADASLPADVPTLWVEAAVDGALRLHLYRPRTGRRISARLALPAEANASAAREAVALRVSFLRETPPTAGSRWTPRRAGPPLPSPNPADPALLASLVRPARPNPPPRRPLVLPPIPAPGPTVANGGASVEIVRAETVEEPAHSRSDTVASARPEPTAPAVPGPALALAGWFGVGGVADVEHVELGFSVGLRLGIGPRWGVRAEAAGFPLRDAGRADLAMLQTTLSAERVLLPRPWRVLAHAGLGYQGLRRDGGGQPVAADHRPAAVLGATLTRRLGGPIGAALSGELAAGYPALEVHSTEGPMGHEALLLRVDLALTWSLDGS